MSDQVTTGNQSSENKFQTLLNMPIARIPVS